MSSGIPPISVTDVKGIRVVNFTDSKILDEANIKHIGDSIGSLIEEHPTPKILLDFTGVDHLSSAALGMLINANKKVKEKNGMLRLAHIKPQIYDVFVITKLNMLFKILPNKQAALDSFANTV
jgi:anti-sigma B factor antagonist